MNRLFSYTMAVDDGSAPNPFRGLCTLAICKPAIRRVAKRGDWVAGLGSVKSRSDGDDLSGRLIYAMRADEVISLQEYDSLAPTRWPHRIPNMNSLDLADRLGDCIYDYSTGRPAQRPGVHGRINQERDLRGLNVLISKHFYYFGRNAIPLPKGLWPICHQTQGHSSDLNDEFLEAFVAWIEGKNRQVGQLYGWPEYVVPWDRIRTDGGCQAHCSDDDMC